MTITGSQPGSGDCFTFSSRLQNLLKHLMVRAAAGRTRSLRSCTANGWSVSGAAEILISGFLEGSRTRSGDTFSLGSALSTMVRKKRLSSRTHRPPPPTVPSAASVLHRGRFLPRMHRFIWLTQ